MQSLHTTPLSKMDAGAAQELVTLGLASWSTNRGKSIRMKALRADPEIRGRSCKPNMRFIEAFAMGQMWAGAVLEGWA